MKRKGSYWAGAQAGKTRPLPLMQLPCGCDIGDARKSSGDSSSPLRGLSPRRYAYGAHALPAELRRHPVTCKERLIWRRLFWATQGRTCARRPFCLVRAADGQQDRLQQAGRLMRGVAAHWWHLAPSARANTAHLPLSCSPLRGLSPRPYAYGAHALPAELRRHPATCKERLS